MKAYHCDYAIRVKDLLHRGPELHREQVRGHTSPRETVMNNDIVGAISQPGLTFRPPATILDIDCSRLRETKIVACCIVYSSINLND